jgi:hypothetical protein
MQKKTFEPVVYAKETIQKFGKVTKDEDGIIAWEACLMLNALIVQMTLRSFNDDRQKIKEARMKAYRTRNINDYNKCIMQNKE